MIFNTPQVQAQLDAVSVLSIGDVVEYIGSNHEIPDKTLTRITSSCIDASVCDIAYTVFQSGAKVYRKDLRLLRKATESDLSLVLLDATAAHSALVAVVDEDDNVNEADCVQDDFGHDVERQEAFNRRATASLGHTDHYVPLDARLPTNVNTKQEDTFNS